MCPNDIAKRVCCGCINQALQYSGLMEYLTDVSVGLNVGEYMRAITQRREEKRLGLGLGRLGMEERK